MAASWVSWWRISSPASVWDIRNTSGATLSVVHILTGDGPDYTCGTSVEQCKLLILARHLLLKREKKWNQQDFIYVKWQLFRGKKISARRSNLLHDMNIWYSSSYSHLLLMIHHQIEQARQVVQRGVAVPVHQATSTRVGDSDSQSKAPKRHRLITAGVTCLA